MTDQTLPSAVNRSGSAPAPQHAGFFSAFEIDPRFLGMIGALILIWIGFHFLTGGTLSTVGTFLSPRNLWNLSVQTASIAVMATGMVLVIVTRHIDLSVGSLLGFTGMVMAIVQADILVPELGFGHPAIWILTLLTGVVVGGLIGAWQGALIAYLSIPAFIVTLGGLLIWRGAAWWVARGETIPLLDANFKLMGGGAEGAIGSFWSWVIAAIACVCLILVSINARRQRMRFNFPLKPLWAEAITLFIGCGVILFAAFVMNSYYLPNALALKYAEAHKLPLGLNGEPPAISFGFAVPVLIAIGVGIFMTFLATRTRFGRYVFAIGGNPEAAELAGINTRGVTVWIFALMGMLAGLSAAIASARLTSATNALGTLDELYTIAAAVIGGTSLAGGSGTIVGAMLGALVMQSLQTGMVLLGLDSPLQNIIVGIVLVVAVWLDTVYRSRLR